MKTLANCSPREFLKQTNRIRVAADKWLTTTKILEIRSRMPKVEAKKPEDKEELAANIEARKRAFAEQARKNAFDMLEAMFETNADGTLELLALSCFVEPEDVDSHTMSEYLICVSELIEDPGVMRFFGSLAKLGLTSSVTASLM
jgi:hypothetical protein